MPTAEASQCVELTAPNVPIISGRVVNLGTNLALRAGAVTILLLG
jgi:hypothetical protein